MALRVLICDDSSFARKQMARALPPDCAGEVSFAADGREALGAIRAGKAELLFLDLNMPVMDGYQVLETIRGEDLNTFVVVVSGDIQPEARQRVMKLGALEFIRKPVTGEDIAVILEKYGLRGEAPARPVEVTVQVDTSDTYREIANVAMGRAADLLARIFRAFVHMPIPDVRMLDLDGLRSLLEDLGQEQAATAVCQSFIGAGIAGEALLVFHECSFSEIASLMKFEGELDGAAEQELLMDMASILIGAFLKGISDQLEISFSQGHPNVLGRVTGAQDLLKRSVCTWKRTLAIGLGFALEGRRVGGNLLLVFSEESVKQLDHLISLTFA
jgi:chemotaxis protein CheY-P-specific phosphatase CheC/CheY-like chemotaxis protein